MSSHIQDSVRSVAAGFGSVLAFALPILAGALAGVAIGLSLGVLVVDIIEVDSTMLFGIMMVFFLGMAFGIALTAFF